VVSEPSWGTSTVLLALHRSSSQHGVGMLPAMPVPVPVAVPTCPWALPAVQLTLLLAVEAVEVAPTAAVNEGPALGDSLVVVPPQRVALAVPLVQRQAAGLSCGGQTAMVRAGRSWQHTGGGGSQTCLAEEKPQKGKAGDGP